MPGSIAGAEIERAPTSASNRTMATDQIKTTAGRLPIRRTTTLSTAEKELMLEAAEAIRSGTTETLGQEARVRGTAQMAKTAPRTRKRVRRRRKKCEEDGQRLA